MVKEKDRLGREQIIKRENGSQTRVEGEVQMKSNIIFVVLKRRKYVLSEPLTFYRI